MKLLRSFITNEKDILWISAEQDIKLAGKLGLVHEAVQELLEFFLILQDTLFPNELWLGSNTVYLHIFYVAVGRHV